MLTLMTSILAVALQVGPGPLVIQAEVVDSLGRPLSGVAISGVVWYQRGSKATMSALEPMTSNGQGQVRLEVARERPIGLVSVAYVWAYQPGHSIAEAVVRLSERASPPPIRLTLVEPAKWTITVLGPDDRPMAGVRIAPYALRLAGGRAAWRTVPDEWFDRLAATTDAQGIATPTCLPPNRQLLAIRVEGPGIARQALPLDAALGKGAIKLGRPGRLVGIVRASSGLPLADVPVEVWAQGAGGLSNANINQSITPNEVLRLGVPPLKTGPQGAFQTPSTLLAGAAYRVSIRHAGYAPFISDWVPLDGERATIPTIRLRPLQKLTGQIKDRQGHAIPGAKVFVTAHGPATATDAEGRFTLGDIAPGTTVVLAEKEGFRLRGWLVDSSAKAEMGALTLARRSEASEPVIKPMAEALSLEQSRALAEDLLKPYLSDELNQGNTHLKLAGIAALSEFDLDRALDLFQNGHFQHDHYYDYVLREMAVKLAEQRPARAMVFVEAIADSRSKIEDLMIVAKALRASERDRKNALLDHAAILLKDVKPYNKLRFEIPRIAEQWLDMGERDRARLLLQKEKSFYDALPVTNAVTLPAFLTQLARLEPDQAMERLRKLPDHATLSDHTTVPTSSLGYDPPAAVALGLATDHPAEAERAFHLWKRGRIQHQTNSYVIPLCRRLARVDPPRARRLAAAQPGPVERAFAWAYVALGLAEKDKPGALEAIDQAIQEIDRLRESGPVPDPVISSGDILSMYPTNPAAFILPVVERAAPERLDEVFWRAVALHPRLEADQDHDFQFSYLGYECILLARYDRAVTAALFAPMDVYLHSLVARKGPRNAFDHSHLVAKGCIDPQAAVALIESLTPPGHFDPPRGEFSPSNPAHTARLALAKALGLPPEKRWKSLWRLLGMHLALDE